MCLQIHFNLIACSKKYEQSETFDEHNIYKFVKSSIKKMETFINCKVSENIDKSSGTNLVTCTKTLCKGTNITKFEPKCNSSSKKSTVKPKIIINQSNLDNVNNNDGPSSRTRSKTLDQTKFCIKIRCDTNKKINKGTKRNLNVKQINVANKKSKKKNESSQMNNVDKFNFDTLDCDNIVQKDSSEYGFRFSATEEFNVTMQTEEHNKVLNKEGNKIECQISPKKTLDLKPKIENSAMFIKDEMKKILKEKQINKMIDFDIDAELMLELSKTKAARKCFDSDAIVENKTNNKDLKNLVVHLIDIKCKTPAIKHKVTILQDVSITGREILQKTKLISKDQTTSEDKMLSCSDWTHIDGVGTTEISLDTSFLSKPENNKDLMFFELLPPPQEFSNEHILLSSDDSKQIFEKIEKNVDNNHIIYKDVNEILTSSSSDESFTIINTHNKSKMFSMPKSKECSPNTYFKKLPTKVNPMAIKPIVSCTRLNKEQVMVLANMHAKNLIIFTNIYDKHVTHMIVNTSEAKKLKDVTAKYILSVAAGIWVLDYQWIQMCYDNNAIVDEEPYEVVDVSGIPGPKNSRITRHNTTPLFNSFQIFVVPPLTLIKKTEIEDVVLMLGGEILSSLKDLKTKKGDKIPLVIAEVSAINQTDLYNVWFKQFNVLTVDIEWLSNSVGQFKIVNLSEYLLCDINNEKLKNYPSELLDDIQT